MKRVATPTRTGQRPAGRRSTAPASTRASPSTSRPASTSARARRRTWRSTSSTTSTRRPSRPPRSSRAARTPRARRSCASPRRSASRAFPSCRRPRARNTVACTPSPSRTAGIGTLGAAVLARPERVRDGADGGSPERGGDRAQGLAQLGRGADRGDRLAPRRCSWPGTDQMAFFASYLRHLLMLLDLRVDVVASPSQEALSRLGRIDAGRRS